MFASDDPPWPNGHFLQEYHSRPLTWRTCNIILSGLSYAHSKAPPTATAAASVRSVEVFNRIGAPCNISFERRHRRHLACFGKLTPKSPRVKPTPWAPTRTLLERQFVISKQAYICFIAKVKPFGAPFLRALSRWATHIVGRPELQTVMTAAVEG
jgi:hypothetical protein